MKQPVKLRYVDSDPSLSSPDSFLSRLVGRAVGREVLIEHNPNSYVDLQFTSVQLPALRRARNMASRYVGGVVSRRLGSRDARWHTENPSPRGRAGAHVWFTGENVRPPFADWDGYLSYDTDPLDGRNAYLPLWFHSSGVLGDATSLFSSVAPDWREMTQERSVAEPRSRFACAFISNPEPMRLHAIRELASLGQVDVFGRAVGRAVADKAAIASRYRFVLCFENDVYPGYVTEKPFEAWATGAVPLWRGSDPMQYLNADAMVNAVVFTDARDFVARVAELNDDFNAWGAVASRPILKRAPDLEGPINLLRRVLDDT